MTDIDKLDEQLNVRVPSWLKTAMEHAAQARSVRGQRVNASDVAREILWPAFEHARPKEVEANETTAAIA